MGAANRHLAVEDEVDTLCVFDHFWQDQSDINAIDTVTDSGTVAMGDAAGGTVVLTPSDGTVADNDEAIIRTPNENFIFHTSNPLYARARLMPTATDISVQNIAFGFVNAAATDPLGDNAGGIKTTGSAFGVQKVDGKSVFALVTANNSVTTTTDSNKSVVSATWYDVELFCVPNGDGTCVCTAKVNGEYLRDSNYNVIRHTVTVASATEMNGFAANKLGAAINNDTLTLDYWLFKQKVF
jgi:hypothetical protein